MKLFFAILVLPALFTEGKGNSGVRQANHKYHALNIRQLLEPAVLHKDEALADFTGTVPVKYKAPVVVDLTKLQEMLEQHFDRIKNHFDTVENHFDTVEANVTANSERFFSFKRKTRTEIESLRASLESLNSTGLNFCQTGVAGCSTCPKIVDKSGPVTREPYKTTITFPKEFPGIPTVTAALNNIYMDAPGAADTYGWGITTESITSSSFTLHIELVDRPINIFYANWIACYTS